MINKLVITKSAIFDYEEIVCNIEMDRTAFRNDVEKIIKNKENPTRIKYVDKKTGKKLMLFIRKGYEFGLMKTWILDGICEERDYDKEMENNGVIAEWLSVIIE